MPRLPSDRPAVGTGSASTCQRAQVSVSSLFKRYHGEFCVWIFTPFVMPLGKFILGTSPLFHLLEEVSMKIDFCICDFVGSLALALTGGSQGSRVSHPGMQVKRTFSLGVQHHSCAFKAKPWHKSTSHAHIPIAPFLCGQLRGRQHAPRDCLLSSVGRPALPRSSCPPVGSVLFLPSQVHPEPWRIPSSPSCPAV